MAAKKKLATTKTAPRAPARKLPAEQAASDPWELDGRLAEAMRASGVKMTPERFAAASTDTCLQDDGVHVVVVNGARVYSTRGAEFATLAITEGVLVLRFAAPRDRGVLLNVEHHYRPVKGRPGWLEYRRPATRTPRPDLEANLGEVLGQLQFERRRKA
jgi:hypothetical protein